MTATPPKQLLSEIPHENIIKLPARFHKNHFQFLNIVISNLIIEDSENVIPNFTRSN